MSEASRCIRQVKYSIRLFYYICCGFPAKGSSDLWLANCHKFWVNVCVFERICGPVKCLNTFLTLISLNVALMIFVVVFYNYRLLLRVWPQVWIDFSDFFSSFYKSNQALLTTCSVLSRMPSSFTRPWPDHIPFCRLFGETVIGCEPYSSPMIISVPRRENLHFQFLLLQSH